MKILTDTIISAKQPKHFLELADTTTMMNRKDVFNIAKVKDLSKYTFNALVLAATFILFVYLLTDIILPKFDIRNLIPEKSKRHDITEIYMESLEKICPNAESGNLVKNLEACVQDKDSKYVNRNFEEIKIGTFEEILKSRQTGFRSTLLKNNKKEMYDLLAKSKSYVLAFKIPSKYYTVKRFGEVINVLKLYAIRDGIACINRRCAHLSSSSSGDGLLSFPLVRTEELTDSEPPLYLFANDGKIPIGAPLNHGIYITKDSNLRNLRQFMAVAISGKTIAFVFFLIAFFLIFYIIGLYTGYLDYMFIGYSLLCMVIVSSNGEIASFLSNGDKLLTWKFITGIYFNFLFSIVLFAISTYRFKRRNLVLFLTYSLLLSAMVVVLNHIAPQDASLYVIHQKKIYLTLSLLFLVAPAAAFGIVAKLFSNQAKRSDKFEMKLAYKNRMYESLSLGGLFFILGLTIFYSHLQHSVLRYAVFPWGGVIYFIAANILLHNSYSRQKRMNVQTKSKSESKRVELLHGKQAALDFRSQQRSSVMPMIDLKNSTEVTDKIGSDMHWVMKSLLTLLNATLAKINHHVLYDKSNGDCHIILASSENSLKEDFYNIITQVREDIAKYRKLLHFFDKSLDVHVNILAINSYRLGGEPRPKTFDKQNLDKLMSSLLENTEVSEPIMEDFIGSECNYLMKYADKAEDGNILLAGDIELFSEEILSEAVKIDTISSLMGGLNKPEKALKKAVEQKLVVIEIPENKIESETDSCSLKIQKIKQQFGITHKSAA